MPRLTGQEAARVPSTLERSPAKAQETFVRAREAAEKSYDGDEAAAGRVAWSAVKRGWEKVGDHWEAKDERGPSDAQAARPSGPAKRDHPRPTAGGVDANATKAHLLDLARRLHVPGRSRMTKAELVDALDAANRKATADAH